MEQAAYVDLEPFLKGLRGMPRGEALGTFDCYAVVMVTRRHRLAELLAHLHALHLATGEHMLLIAPEFPLEGAPGPAETSRALAEGSFVDRSGTRVNLNAEVQRF